MNQDGFDDKETGKVSRVVLEGNVVVREGRASQDGCGVEKNYQGERVYYDFRELRCVVLEE